MLKLVKRNKLRLKEMAKKTHILPDFENHPYKLVHGLPCFESIPVLNYLCHPLKGGEYQITNNKTQKNPKYQIATNKNRGLGSGS
jgi:hypothetical protein